VPSLRAFLSVILLTAAASPALAQTTINLSHDLVQLGIANQRMVPNMSALDSQPLFVAALQYVQSNPVQLVTADPGAYYFLAPADNPAIYV